jgi:hypothetical protein
MKLLHDCTMKVQSFTNMNKTKISVVEVNTVKGW